MIKKKTIKFLHSIIIAYLIFTLFSCSPPTSIEIEKSWAEQTLQDLTLREKIAQMLIYPMFLKFRNTENKQWQELIELAETDGIGGIHLWSGSAGLSVTMLNELQYISKVPIIVDLDIERGLQQRFPEGTQFPTAMALAATGDPQNAYKAGKVVAIEGRSVGAHWSLAPIVDVNNNPDNPIINTRTFSDVPEMVAEFAEQYIYVLHAGKMLATAKNFPGHGDTKTDSHISLAEIPSDSTRLWSIELAPYKRVITSGVDAIMVAHLTSPDYQVHSQTPATLSKFWIQDVLRGMLGFRGAVVTDAMDMGAITQNYSNDYAIINAINAGCDIIIQNHDFRYFIDTIENAVKTGLIEQSRINEAALQMLQLKEKVGLHLSKTTNLKTMQRNLGLEESHRIAKDIAQKAITLVRNEHDLIPLSIKNGEQIFVIDLFGEPHKHEQSIATKMLLKNGLPIEFIAVDESDSTEYLQLLINQIPKESQIIINAFAKPRERKGTVYLTDTQTRFVRSLIERSNRIILISYGNPYLIRDFPEIPAYLCAWYDQSNMQEASTKALLGQKGISGKLPISIPGIAERGSGIHITARPIKYEVEQFISGKRLKNVMPYEINADVKIMKKLLWQAVVDSAFPGGVLLAAKGGKIFINESFGFHTYAKKELTSRGDIFDLASISKVVSTTSAIMKLLDQGEIRLDNAVGGYIPEFIDKNLADSEIRKLVTIKHLLTHTSGLPPFKLFYEIDGDFSTRIDSGYKTKLNSMPGERYVYSDIGFILLGKIVERISGKPLDQFVRDE
ncbi:MAG: glycoside hydrolase family 3 N-terminal domain-containing protein, partial [Candidatus Neomarinimicrobiota bacterium]